MYTVVEKFRDLKDNEHIYNVGDTYPREGINIEDVDSKRIKELSSKKNKIGKVLIQEVKEEKTDENVENNKKTDEQAETMETDEKTEDVNEEEK